MAHIEGYADYIVEMTRERLGYNADDNSHDDEVLVKLNAGEKLSKSKHVKAYDLRTELKKWVEEQRGLNGYSPYYSEYEDGCRNGALGILDGLEEFLDKK